MVETNAIKAGNLRNELSRFFGFEKSIEKTMI